MNHSPTLVNELKSKIIVLEEENQTLASKTEENLLLNRAFEDINAYDKDEGFITSALESISILLDIPFAGLFEEKDGKLIFKEHYALFSHEENLKATLQIDSTIVKKVISGEKFLLQKNKDEFIFDTPNSNYKPHQAFLITFSAHRILNRFFVFISDISTPLLEPKIPILEKIVGIIAARYEKFYYQRELKNLNAKLEQKVIARTVELVAKNKELELSQKQLLESEQNLSTTLRSIGDGVFATDEHGLVVNMNPVAEKMCGWSFREAKGKPLSEVFVIVNAKTRQPSFNPVGKVLCSGKVVGLANHTTLIAKDGSEYQIADSAAPIRNANGDITGVVLVVSDVSEKYAQEERLAQAQEELTKNLEHQLYIDELTKLKSRACLLKDIKTCKHPALILVDINAFKTVNELYGIEVGNEVLVLFSTILKNFASLKKYEAYRISGDEFVLFKDIASANSLLCEDLLSKLFKFIKKTPIFSSLLGESLYIDISAGASFETINLVGTANIALNYAKEHYKPYAIFSQEMDSHEKITYGALWKKKIILGIQDRAFVPFFQPIVDRKQNIIEYEALMRFREPDNSYTSPCTFLDIAIKTRHYDEISQMTLLKSLQICAKENITVSLNLNYQDILNTELHQLLKKVLHVKGIGGRVIFEIVESQDIENYDILKTFITEFKALGVRFAIDDFGTGFSNFTHILEFSPDFVKIDGSLVKNINSNKKSLELVKAIVAFSQQMGIQTIAEFVHSKEVFEIVFDLGIDYFQGYYFGMPCEFTQSLNKI